MDRSFASGAAGSPPSYPGSPSIGYPTAGNPSLAIPATKPGPWWYYMINEELRAVLVAAGVTPDGSNTAQLLQAIQILIANGSIKIPVRAASTVNIASLAGGAPNTLDGVTLAANDRVLVKDQGTGSQNGIYVVTTLGTGANGTWTRATDADGAGELLAGSLVVVQEGTAAADTLWEVSTDGALTIGTTALTFMRKDGATATGYVPVRQTVLSGPVDAAGNSAFGGGTGATTVTASGTLKATAAAAGDANYIGSITNPSWTGLSTNGTMYLYLDITSGGAVTTGSTTLAPVYQWGGTYSVTNNQHTFNIQEMTLKVGNGAAATQVYRVFVGQVTVAGAVVTAITWYALMGRYVSPLFGLAFSTSYTNNHNIGVRPMRVGTVLVNQTAEANYAINDEAWGSGIMGDNNPEGISTAIDATVATTAVGPTVQPLNKTTGAFFTLTTANWKMKVYANRGW